MRRAAVFMSLVLAGCHPSHQVPKVGDEIGRPSQWAKAHSTRTRAEQPFVESWIGSGRWAKAIDTTGRAVLVDGRSGKVRMLRASPSHGYQIFQGETDCRHGLVHLSQMRAAASDDASVDLKKPLSPGGFALPRDQVRLICQGAARMVDGTPRQLAPTLNGAPTPPGLPAGPGGRRAAMVTDMQTFLQRTHGHGGVMSSAGMR